MFLVVQIVDAIRTRKPIQKADLAAINVKRNHAISRLRKAVKREAKLTASDENEVMQRALSSMGDMKAQNTARTEKKVVWREFEDEVTEAMDVMAAAVRGLRQNPASSKFQNAFIAVEKVTKRQKHCYTKFEKPKKSAEVLLELGESYTQDQLDDMMEKDPAAVYEMQAKQKLASSKQQTSHAKKAPAQSNTRTLADSNEESQTEQLTSAQEKAEVDTAKAEDAAIRDIRRFGKIQRPSPHEVAAIKAAAAAERYADKERQKEVLAAAEGELLKNLHDKTLKKVTKQEHDDAVKAAREEKQAEAVKAKKEAEAQQIREEARRALGESRRKPKKNTLSNKARFLVKQADMMESAAETMKKRIDENAHGASTLERSAEKKLFRQQVDRTEDARSAAREELKDEGVTSGREADALQKGNFIKEVKYELGDGESLSALQMHQAKRNNAKEQMQIKEKVAAGQVDLNNMDSFRKYLKTATKNIVAEEERKAEKATGTDGADVPTVAQEKLASLDAVAEQAKQEEQKLQNEEDKQLAKEKAKASKLKEEERERQSAKITREDTKVKQALDASAASRSITKPNKREEAHRREEAQKQALEAEADATLAKVGFAKPKATEKVTKLSPKDLRKLEQKASDERKAAELDADSAQRTPTNSKWLLAQGDKEMEKANADQAKADELCKRSPRCKQGMDMIDRAEAIMQYVRSIQKEYRTNLGRGVYWAGLSVCMSHGRGASQRL